MLTGTNGFAGFLEVKSCYVYSNTLNLASSGIASSMDTVASKVLMEKPPLLVCIVRKSISPYKGTIHEEGMKFNGNLEIVFWHVFLFEPLRT